MKSMIYSIKEKKNERKREREREKERGGERIRSFMKILFKNVQINMHGSLGIRQWTIN